MNQEIRYLLHIHDPYKEEYDVLDLSTEDIQSIDRWLFTNESMVLHIDNKALENTIEYLKDVVVENNLKNAKQLKHYFKKKNVQNANFVRQLIKKYPPNDKESDY